METIDEILEHHGIRGMKWGIRRSRSEIDSSPDAKAAKATAAKIKSAGGTHAVSNSELQQLVQRMNLESQLSTLTSKQATTVSKGHSQIKTLLGIAKTAQEIHNFANSGLAKDFAKAMNKAHA